MKSGGVVSTGTIPTSLPGRGVGTYGLQIQWTPAVHGDSLYTISRARYDSIALHRISESAGTLFCLICNSLENVIADYFATASDSEDESILLLSDSGLKVQFRVWDKSNFAKYAKNVDSNVYSNVLY